MTRFVKITLANGKCVWLNPDTVSAVFQHDDGKVSVYGVGDLDLVEFLGKNITITAAD